MKAKIQFLIIFFSIIFSSLFADDVSTPAELETAIINANSGGTNLINFTDNISYSQNFRPLNVDGTFSNVGLTYTIEGNTKTLSTAGTFRGFFVGGNPTTSSSGIITIQNLTIDAAKAQAGNAGNGAGGGAGLGGGLFINKGTTVRLSNVVFTNCSAQGGNGIGAGRGGGGGMGGNGGDRGPSGGCGGGGSLFFDGGTGGNSSGGGGAGIGFDGQNGGNSISGNGGNNFIGTGGGAGNSSGDGSAGSQGGGGGAGRLSAGTNGGAGSFGGGGGAAQGSGISNGGAGGFGGGGGGSQEISGGTQNGGTGGFGGGGGGVPSITLGGDGGFGGGGARGRTGGFGGGTGSDGTGGGGGAMGGTIFIAGDGTLDQSDSSSISLAGELQITGSGISSSNSSLTAGTGGNNGSTFGIDIFMMSGGQITISGLTSDISIPNAIESDQGVGIPNSSTTTGGIKLDTSIGANTATFTLNGSNTYTGTTQINSGTLILNGNLLASTPVSIGTSGIFNFGNINGTFNSFAVTNGNQVNLTTDTGNTSTYGGNISSTGAVTKTGDGIICVFWKQ